MREYTENTSEMTEPKNQSNSQSREQERPRYDASSSESDEPQICRGVD